MQQDGYELDAEIIRDAYAEKVKDAFRLFAENIAVGQNEKNCRDRFVRALELARKARDIALEASGSGDTTAGLAAAAALAATTLEPTAELLSPEDQALIDPAVGATTGTHPPAPIRHR